MEQVQQVLKAKNYWEVYSILEMRKQFDSQVTQTLKFVKLLSSNGNSKVEMQRLYFSQCFELGTQPYFVQITLKSMQTMLSTQPIDLRIIQNNNDDIITSSNILEAIRRNAEDKAKQIIFQHLKGVIQKGLLFHLRYKSSIILKNVEPAFKTIFQKYKPFIKHMVQAQTKKIASVIT